MAGALTRRMQMAGGAAAAAGLAAAFVVPSLGSNRALVGDHSDQGYAQCSDSNHGGDGTSDTGYAQQCGDQGRGQGNPERERHRGRHIDSE